MEFQSPDEEDQGVISRVQVFSFLQTIFTKFGCLLIEHPDDYLSIFEKSDVEERFESVLSEFLQKTKDEKVTKDMCYSLISFWSG